MPFEDKFEESICTYNKYIGIAYSEFLSKIDSYYIVAIGIRNIESYSLNMDKIALDLYSLINEWILISIMYFLSLYHYDF